MDGVVNALRAIGTAKLVIMGLVAGTLLTFFLFIGDRLSQPTMSLLYGELDTQDSGAIVTRLEELNIPYNVRANGSQIFVPEEQALKLRMQMAAQGLPSGGSLGYELFDRSDNLSTTSFVQNLNRVRAMEGELSRTIKTIDAIAAARVHLVLPKRQLFNRDKSEPSASIVLKSRAGGLSQGQVRAIQYMVAAAVPDLKTERVSIVDDKGNLLTRFMSDSGDPMASQASEFRVSYENRMRAAIESLVEQSVGYGAVRAQVSATINFDRVTENSEIYDPDSQVARSTQTVEESEQSTERDRDETVTVENNLPQAAAGGETGDTSDSQSNRLEETVNFEISRRRVTEVRGAGNVERVSVAVLVDGTYVEDEAGEAVYQARSDEDLQQIEKLVKTAIGFDAERGDQVEIINLKFAKIDDALEDIGEDPPFLSKSDYLRFGELFALLLVAILTIFLVARPLINKLFEKKQPPSAATALTVAADNADLPEELQQKLRENAEIIQAIETGEISKNDVRKLIDDATGDGDNMLNIEKVEGQVKESTLKQLSELVNMYPEESLQLLRTWLYQEEPA